ncbi:CROWDED NUCLEI 1 protein [Nymphaea thermarum]|nr:CROWDED NUCLEI 1 protein [Nymphaea thermarum]
MEKAYRKVQQHIQMEKALHEMHVESAEVKFTSNKKLAEAQALVAGVEEKSMEAEAKINSAEAGLQKQVESCLKQKGNCKKLMLEKVP